LRKLAKASNPNVNLDNITQGSQYAMSRTQKLTTSSIDLRRLNKIENSNSLIQKEKLTSYRLRHYNLPYAKGPRIEST
jgi:hypothetical protein